MRRGLTLIEVLVAVAILGVGVVAWAGIAGQGIDAIRTTERRESEFQRASALLTRISLWSIGQLDASIGVHTVGALQVAIAKSDGPLFAVVVADSHGSPLMSTTFYRRDTSAAIPR